MGPTQTPPLASTESLIRRYKHIWRVLLLSNLALGGYIFAKAGKKKSIAADKRTSKPREDEVSSGLAPASPLSEETLVPTTDFEPMQAREPIPQDQPREIFKWILYEKEKGSQNISKRRNKWM